jgi:hypothetical protein
MNLTTVLFLNQKGGGEKTPPPQKKEGEGKKTYCNLHQGNAPYSNVD